IIMTGYLFGDAYREISCHCRFFVLPAGIDGTRPVLLDQMGFGNCVVVKNTPANINVIGDAGLSFDRHRKVDSLTKRIEEISSNYGIVELFRKKALARIKTHYSWERVTDKYESLFNQMMKK
ncbi:MAG: glycosyltransferase, partial [Desulfobulbaceae bacterium]|nr:glycosyltransferase [Desulfobulbaceae bacterium]